MGSGLSTAATDSDADEHTLQTLLNSVTETMEYMSRILRYLEDSLRPLYDPVLAFGKVSVIPNAGQPGIFGTLSGRLQQRKLLCRLRKNLPPDGIQHTTRRELNGWQEVSNDILQRMEPKSLEGRIVMWN